MAKTGACKTPQDVRVKCQFMVGSANPTLAKATANRFTASFANSYRSAKEN
jgi:hypothetical protein